MAFSSFLHILSYLHGECSVCLLTRQTDTHFANVLEALEFLDARSVTWSNFHIEHAHILGSTTRKLAVWATCLPAFVHPWDRKQLGLYRLSGCYRPCAIRKSDCSRRCNSHFISWATTLPVVAFNKTLKPSIVLFHKVEKPTCRRALWSVLLTKYYSCDEINKNEVGGVGGTYGRQEVYSELWWGNLKERD
jgi:hypothetical protein